MSARSKKKPVPQEPTPDEGKTSPADSQFWPHLRFYEQLESFCFAVNLSPYPTNSCCKGILLLSFLSDVDMQHYNNLLDRVPDDICSVPLILHCVVEQVRV